MYCGLALTIKNSWDVHLLIMLMLKISVFLHTKYCFYRKKDVQMF